MSAMEIRRREPGATANFAEHLHPVLRRVYAARGIGGDLDLDLSLERLLPIGSLEGLEAATRLLAAHRSAGRVLVVGDFDADGATSTALVVRALRAMHFAHVDFLVPNRFRFGYGLTPEIVALAAERATDVDRDGGQWRIERRRRGSRARDRHTGARHRSSSAGRCAAARGGDRESQPIRPADSRVRRWPASALLFMSSPPSPRCWVRRDFEWPTCWIWSRSGRWPTWCRSTATIESWWRKD